MPKRELLDTGAGNRHIRRDERGRFGLPRQLLHHLRHAFVTLMIEPGEDLGVVSRILGLPTC
jgi:hypothetical protein